MTAIFYLQIHQMAVKTTFLNGDLNEEIYMDQPECFVEADQESKVCKLTKIPIWLEIGTKAMT